MIPILNNLSEMYRDIKKYEFVRKKFYGIILFAVFSIVFPYLILWKEDLLIKIFMMVSMLSVILTSWFVGYFRGINPIIRKFETENRLKSKYGVLYDNFMRDRY